MEAVDQELEDGIFAYLQKGTAASPRNDDTACRAVARVRSPEELLAVVEAVVAESLAVPIDWSSVSLSDAGRRVAAVMQERHPGLTTEAAQALAWNVTFTWR